MRALILALALVAIGCLPKSYRCASSSDCGTSGICEANGFCAYTDSACTSGFRYGDLSGSVSHVCVGSEQQGDGGVDTGDSGSGTTDTDGDGIPDATDNCPAIANAMQENEDGDKFGDACDPCPPVADDNPPDADGDGVADACDPRPGTPGDTITLFEGFHHGIPAGWEVVGTWTNPTDDAATTAGTGNVLSVPGPTTKHETVSAAMVVDTTTTLSYSGPFDDHPTGGTGIACVPYIANVTPSPGLSVNLMGTATAQSVAYEMTTGATYILKLRRDLQVFTCVGTNAMTAATATTTFSNGLDTPSPMVGLWVNGSTVRFHWLMVVSNP